MIKIDNGDYFYVNDGKSIFSAVIDLPFAVIVNAGVVSEDFGKEFLPIGDIHF